MSSKGMSEDYRIFSAPRGEPRALGDVDVCIRVRDEIVLDRVEDRDTPG